MRIHSRTWACKLITTSLFLSVLAVFAFAQSDLTSVHGTIQDPTGATVAGATVTVRNTATGLP